MIVLDASVMIAILDGADSHFKASQRLFVDHATERLGAHRMTIAETLVRPAIAGRARAAAAALAMLGIGQLDEPDDPVGLAELRASTGLRLPDAVILNAAIRERARLATFDERLARAAVELGVTVVAVESNPV